MKNFVTNQMEKINSVGRRFTAFVNPPPLPGGPSSTPRLRDYPVTKPTRTPR